MPTTEIPIRKELQLTVPPERAFALFTAEIAAWWPLATHSVGGEAAVDVALDGRVGGQIVETTRDGTRHVWGTVSAWDPPRAFTSSWHPGRPASGATELEVRFEPSGDGCRVVLEHRGWDRDGWGAQRASYEPGWDAVLARYVERAAATAGPITGGERR